MKKKGFTLVELLVVIAIIALLVSILLPSLGRAKELANRTRCMANLSGMGKAGAIYMTENDDKFPSMPADSTADKGYAYGTGTAYGALRSTTGRVYGHSITSLMFLIVRSTGTDTGLFVCPSDTSATKDNSPKDPNTSVYYWDFHGATATDYAGAASHVSYSHQMVLPSKSLVSTRQFWIADKNPNWDGTKTTELTAAPMGPDVIEATVKLWNSGNHNGELNNALMGDGSTSKNNRCDVGSLVTDTAGKAYSNDNIYSNYGTAPNTCQTATKTGDKTASSWSGWDSGRALDAYMVGPYPFPS